MNRRQFIKTAAMAATATSALNLTSNSALAEGVHGVQWTVGCFNRPWVNVDAGWTLDTALESISAAGYRTMGLLTPFKGEPFIGADATPEYLASLKEKVAKHHLNAIMGAIHTKPKLPLDGQIADVRKQIDNGKTLRVEWLLTFGTDHPADYDNYYKTMADAAPYAQERGIKLVLKPHGGGSGASEEILRCMAKVNHPNFKIWYDAGNIIYYTGKDPLEQLKPIAEHVTGFCAKDCSGEKGDVWLEFGTGKVDFRAVFTLLKNADFNGPVMVECCKKGKTPEETSDGARRNREFLENLFAQI
jgi:sugar phosphate isomerase/epimerase